MNWNKFSRISELERIIRDAQAEINALKSCCNCCCNCYCNCTSCAKYTTTITYPQTTWTVSCTPTTFSKTTTDNRF